MTDKSECAFGELFHTAFRKGSDTKWSSLMWNILNLESDDFRSAWKSMCDYCQEKWENGIDPSKCAKQWAKTQEHTFRSRDAIILATSIELMDNETWDDVDETMEYWVKYD